MKRESTPLETYKSGQPYKNIVRLKLKVTDGKMRETDAVNTKQLLRIVQSVPSPKAKTIQTIVNLKCVKKDLKKVTGKSVISKRILKILNYWMNN